MTPRAIDLARSRTKADVGALRRVARIYRARGARREAHFWDEAAEVADTLAELARRYYLAEIDTTGHEV